MQQSPAKSRMQELLEYRPSRIQVIRFGISLVLAILLWGWVTQIQNPYDTRTLAGNTMQTGPLSDTLQIVSTLPDARVTVKGGRSDVEAVRQSDIDVTADTSGIVEAGTYQVDVVVTGLDNVNDYSVDPSQVTIQVDDRISQVEAVRISATSPDGSPLLGSLDGIQPLVSQVTVTGPRSAVERVQDVILPVTVNPQMSAYDTSVTPYAADAEGLRIAEVEVLPSSVPVRVDVPQTGRSVSVIPTVTGVPAEGYTIEQRRALPDTILVDGPEDALADLLFVNTKPVDVTDATESISTMVGLADLPDGVTAVNPVDGMVEVRVAIEDSSTSFQTLPGLPIEVVGLEDGLGVDLAPETVTIQVSAPYDVLQLMTPSDITVLVDVSNLETGTYVVPPEVTLPPGATWSIADEDAELVRVVISDDNASSPQPNDP